MKAVKDGKEYPVGIIPQNYITKTDRLSDEVEGALDIKDLFTPSSGYYGKYTNRSNIVVGDINCIFNDSGSSYTDIGLTLASGYRPAYPIYSYGVDINTGNHVLMLINTDGKIEPFEGGTQNQIHLLFNFSFAV
jgi:hypothetical protein